jgi:hypothetical protein
MPALRHLWISAAILVSPAAPSYAIESNFWCSPTFGVCGCDINERADCGFLRKNCKDGKFTICMGTKCYCELGPAVSAIGTAPSVLPRRVLQIAPGAPQQAPQVKPLSR